MARRVSSGVALLTCCLALTVSVLCQMKASAALELLRAGHWREAAAGFAAEEKAQPGKTDALLYEAKALVNLGEFRQADEALREFLLSHPKSDDALYLLAFVRFRENQPTESLQLYTEAAKVKPPTADDLKIVALDYVLLKDFTSAGRQLEEVLRLEPANLEARYHLGRVRYQQNQFDQAVAAFREVLKHDPNNVKAEDNLGLSLEGKDQVDDAILAYRRAIQLDRVSLVRTEQPYLDLSILLAKLNQPKEAVFLLEEAARIAPHSGQVHRELGRAYFGLQQFEDAQREAERAVQIDPQDSAAHYLLGRVYHRLGKSDLATREFSSTEELIRLARAKTGGVGMSGTESK